MANFPFDAAYGFWPTSPKQGTRIGRSLAPRAVRRQVGQRGRFILNPHTPGATCCRSKGVDEIKARDLLSIGLPGSSGYSPPVEPELEKIWDVRNEKMSLELDRE